MYHTIYTTLNYYAEGKVIGNVQKDINNICNFLALRHLKTLSKKSLQDVFGISKVDVLVVFGNDLPSVAEDGCRAYEIGICDYILMSGGVGHSTETLKNKVKKINKYKDCNFGETEGEIYAEIAKTVFEIPKDKILIENNSTNCSENGQFAIQLLQEQKIPHKTIMLMQDPTMQYRSYMSMNQFIPISSTLISYAPFIPRVDENIEYMNKEKRLWTKERFLELLMGEIWRLRDDENGYGPNGKNYIGHVNIPNHVEKSYENIKRVYGKYSNRCN